MDVDTLYSCDGESLIVWRVIRHGVKSWTIERSVGGAFMWRRIIQVKDIRRLYFPSSRAALRHAAVKVSERLQMARRDREKLNWIRHTLQEMGTS